MTDAARAGWPGALGLPRAATWAWLVAWALALAPTMPVWAQAPATAARGAGPDRVTPGHDAGACRKGRGSRSRSSSKSSSSKSSSSKSSASKSSSSKSSASKSSSSKSSASRSTSSFRSPSRSISKSVNRASAGRSAPARAVFRAPTARPRPSAGGAPSRPSHGAPASSASGRAAASGGAPRFSGDRAGDGLGGRRLRRVPVGTPTVNGRPGSLWFRPSLGLREDLGSRDDTDGDTDGDTDAAEDADEDGKPRVGRKPGAEGGRTRPADRGTRPPRGARPGEDPEAAARADEERAAWEETGRRVEEVVRARQNRARYRDRNRNRHRHFFRSPIPYPTPAYGAGFEGGAEPGATPVEPVLAGAIYDGGDVLGAEWWLEPEGPLYEGPFDAALATEEIFPDMVLVDADGFVIMAGALVTEEDFAEAEDADRGTVDDLHPAEETTSGLLSGVGAGEVEDAGPRGFIEAIRLDFSMSYWSWQPIAVRTGDPWRAVVLREDYDLGGLALYRAAARFDTRHARVQLGWQSNQGLTVGDLRGALFDVLVAFNVFGDMVLTAEFAHLAFDQGTVTLRDTNTDTVLETARAASRMDRFEVRLGGDEAIYFFGRYIDSALPRNVYLQESEDEEVLAIYEVSDRLMRVDSQTFSLGAGLNTMHPLGKDLPMFHASLNGGLGFGSYTLNTLNGGDRLDDGWLMVLHLGVEAGVQLPLGQGFAVGLRTMMNFMLNGPLGLPDDLERDLRAEGLDTDNFTLVFGTVEFVTQGMAELSWSW